METHRVSAMEVKIISEVCLKPSSPTPPLLRHLKLSILDQLIPAPYGPIVFFYNQLDDHLDDSARALRLLKDSLSHILPVFYPLAGCVEEEFTVDCNDDGFRYLEARVNCDMDDYLSQPDLLMLQKLLPVDVEQTPGSHVGNVQINVFKCGSLAIGLCVSHKILDGAGISIFINAWAAATRGDFEAIISPNFNSALVFPAANSWFKEASRDIWGAMFRPGKFVTKRLVFDSASIVKLKDEIVIGCESSKQPPTQIEAVSAMLWKSFIKGSRKQEADNNGTSKPSVMTHLVNLRHRILNSSPHITNQTLCNLLWMASSTVPPHTELELSNLSDKVRRSIAEVDSDFINKLRSSEAKPAVTESLKGITEPGSNMLGFSSWCKLGLYEADFGWGRPVWISSIGMKASVFFNLVMLVETRDGESMEAWVTMDECDMNLLAQDSELGRFASMDPSPL